MHSVAVKGHPGIRKKPSGKYLAAKSIKRKKYYQEFGTLREAVKWKNEFHPLVSPNPSALTEKMASAIVIQQNGRDNHIFFQDVWELYQKRFLKTLHENTQDAKARRAKHFFPNLFLVRMHQMSPDVISQHIDDMKLVVSDGSRRCNFEKELKDLNSVFNWYAEHVDFTFHNPVRRFHYKLGKIKDVIPKKRNMRMDQMMQFFWSFKSNEDGFMFQTLAITEFIMAGRIQEAAAINDRTLDFKLKEVSISEKIVWLKRNKGRPKHEIGTKTGSSGVATIELPDELLERFQILAKRRPHGCKYFFQKKGKPLRYNLIWNRYKEALKDAGLVEEFAGTNTNLLRHSMATLAREKGGIDACQAILRHTSARMSEHYGKLDVNKKVSQVVIQAAEVFRKANLIKSEVGVTKSYQEAVNDS